MSKTVRWGLLGTGRIARDFATALRATPGASIAAVASREHATAAAFAADFDIPLALGSYDGLAACPDVDVVYIGTPHALHADNALTMLAGGKGVLCEKPFALNRAQAATVVLLVFFLLLGGDTFKRKLVQLTGPSLSKRKITVNILDDINRSIQKYMLMLLTTNLLVALLSWAAFGWIGLDNPAAWAAVAGLLHIVPYLGPVVTAVATGIAAFLQFESLTVALLVAGASLAIATLVGTFVTTWMVGRIAHMNSAAVFISLLFWGWLWGVWGMLLSIPIIVIVKVVSQHVEQLHPMAELLGD